MTSRNTGRARTLSATLLALSLAMFGVAADADGNAQRTANANENSKSDIAIIWNTTADAIDVVSSPKALNYVVILYCSGAVEKYGELTGREASFSGNGSISSVMVKAGSSTDTVWSPNNCSTRPDIPW